MSRALYLSIDEQHVTAACGRLDLPISTIETLPSGDTRVVLRNGDAAAALARHFRKDVLSPDRPRTPRAVQGYGAKLPMETAPADVRRPIALPKAR